MKYLTEYRDPKRALAIVGKIKDFAGSSPMTFMEVCGTHTMAIARFGIKKLLPETIRLISGPGCPVCVTPIDYIDRAIAVAKGPKVIVCTFGDMMRVPGSSSTLDIEHARGSDIRIVYSTLDALDLAKNNPENEVVFLGIGFETTAPTVASAIITASKSNITNFSVLCAHKTVPRALEALLSGGVKLNGFLLPGHVSTIIGSEVYRPVLDKHGIGGVIAGFEPTDILEAILELTTQVLTGRPAIHTSYVRAVTKEGNVRAMDIQHKVFEPCQAHWRGLGDIPQSGLKIRSEYSIFDASNKFDIKITPAKEPAGCRCGDILCGSAAPPDCPLFGKSCTPDNPIGACMVSGEGTCAAYFKYGR